jgi:hypothetical protein
MISSSLSTTDARNPARPRSPWARLGLAGFLFFLLKGLLWLLVPALLWSGS